MSFAQGFWGERSKTIFGTSEEPALLKIENLPIEATLTLERGWKPVFQNHAEPEIDPLGSRYFGFPWEPATPLASPNGLALNGPQGRSKIYLWKNLDWRTYTYEVPIVSFRFNPRNAKQALVTFQYGRNLYETQLIDYPENRVRWSTPSGPWSRFSWNGQSVLLGFFEKTNRLLVSSRSVDQSSPRSSLASYQEPDFQKVPKDVITLPQNLSETGQDFTGDRLMLIWSKSHQLWFPKGDQMWVSDGFLWTLWRLYPSGWKRTQGGAGRLTPHFPDYFLIQDTSSKIPLGYVEVADRAPLTIKDINLTLKSLPDDYDRWFWKSDGAVSYEGERWGSAKKIPPTLWIDELRKTYASETRRIISLRPELKPYLSQGPAVHVLESHGKAWVWVGDQIHLIKLLDTSTTRAVRAWLR